MKLYLIFLLLTFTTLANAELCTSVIKDKISGDEYETFNRSSYSRESACDLALFDCDKILSLARSNGHYLNAQCVVKSSTPTNPIPPTVYTCRTDLVDIFGRILRIYVAPGSSKYDACNISTHFCLGELPNVPYAFQCLIRGYAGQDQSTTQECNVNRIDSHGIYLQNYIAKTQGINLDEAKFRACQMAMETCARDVSEGQNCVFVD